jgi:hypothetical protein
MDGRQDETPEAAARREAVKAASASLRGLHHALVEAARERYAATSGPVDSPGEMLRLLMHEPEFAWLRQLSGLMVDVDELLDLAEISERDAAAVRVEIERLIAAPADDPSFGAHYREALQGDPDVVIAHGKTRAAVGALPTTSDEEREGASAHRRAWSERRAEQRRR